MDHAIVVPAAAIQTRYGTSVAFVVQDGTLKASEVTLGDRLGPRVEVAEGLEAGQIIVADQVDGLTAGLKVRPRAADAAGKETGADGRHKKGAPK